MLGLTTDPSPHGLSSAQQSKTMTRHQGSGQSSKGSSAEAPKTNTIFGRNHAAAIEQETILWGALCDNPEKATKYIADDAVMVNPFMFGDMRPKGKDTEPSLKEALESGEPVLSFKIQDSKVVEIDLMAVTILYSGTLFRQVGDGAGGEGKVKTINVTGSSTWRQVAGGDWVLAAMHVVEVPK